MRRIMLLGVALATSVLSTFAAEVPKGFRLEPVLGGLTSPSALAGTPDGRILIAERTTGFLRVVQLGELQAAPLCSIAVNATGEGGLLGVAVHPNYRLNGFVYLHYTDSATGKNRVGRVVIQANTCSTPTVILSDLGAGAGFLRNGGGLAFGPDGKLYVATGDTQDSSNGQNASTLPAKVLRVNDDGSVPLDNPTPGSLVYARGVRDGRAVAINPAGQVYVTDRGSDVDSAHDELNAVAANGNLGWAVDTGLGSMVSWLAPTIGVHGLAAYTSTRYPDLEADLLDSDHDGWGIDRFPGVARFDDDGTGVCVGSVNNGLSCTTNANCPQVSGELSYCEKRDEPDEWCPGGAPFGDDDCDATGAAGVDEPDESFVNSLFASGATKIQRAVPTLANLDQLSSWNTFVDSSFLPDCPVGWTGVMQGRDGILYALATNGGGAGAGALYRVLHQSQVGPREVSATASYFPLRVDKGTNAGEVVVYWEDLRTQATQPRNSGATLLPPEREYAVWKGTIGSWYSHGTAPIPALSAIPGTAVNDAYRKTTVTVNTAANEYFLVSARHANYQGTLGSRTNPATERPGYPKLCNGGPNNLAACTVAGDCPSGSCVANVCDSGIGYYKPASWTLFTCGFDFALIDEHDLPTSLYQDYRGKVVVMDFSAIWCAPCHLEANRLQQVYNDYKDRDVEFVTVLMDEETLGTDWVNRPAVPECRNWGDRPSPNLDHTFACLADPQQPGQVAWPKYNSFGALPTTVVIDTGGRVAYRIAGWNDPPPAPQTAEAALRAKLNELLGGATDTCLH